MKFKEWLQHPAAWLELFIVANLAFLALDIYIAHSMNQFAHVTEWIPFVFSLVATFLLVPFFPRSPDDLVRGRSRLVGLVVGVSSIVVGVAGLLLHLDSQFFLLQTIESLVYTAPFVAPLSYAGLGFLLLLNRMEAIDGESWCNWILVLAAGGVLGNFILALADHAQNGFFHNTEWIPVYASAVMLGVLVALLSGKSSTGFVVFAAIVVVLHAVVGVLGFAFHGLANFDGVSSSLWDNTVYGAPLFAPLLLANISLLIGISLWRKYFFKQGE